MNKDSGSVDQYVSRFPPEVQQRLEKIRSKIREAAPAATEMIKYGIPTFVLGSTNLVHFAGYKNHIGFYPSPSGIEAFKDEFAQFKMSKGAVQFPLDGKIPFGLIQRVVAYRVREINEKGSGRKTRKT